MTNIVWATIKRAIIKGVLDTTKISDSVAERVNRAIVTKISLFKIVVLGTTEEGSFF